MTATEFESLRADIQALRNNMEIRLAKIEAQLDAKPSTATLYQAVVTMMFGIGAVITGTVVVLKNIGSLS
jgi:hypothetical protein